MSVLSVLSASSVVCCAVVVSVVAIAWRLISHDVEQGGRGRMPRPYINDKGLVSSSVPGRVDFSIACLLSIRLTVDRGALIQHTLTLVVTNLAF